MAEHSRLQIFSTCRALITILDELPPKPVLVSDRLIPLNQNSQIFNVVLILTGDNSGLSTPVTFDSLRSRSLPLARTDFISNNEVVDAIRVPIALAVSFVAELERKEQATLHGMGSSRVDVSICPFAVPNGPCIPSADEWVDEVISRAVDKGKENVYETRVALSRIKAAQRGEEDPYGGLPPYFNARWI